MNIKEIEKLIKLISQLGLEEINIETEVFKLSIKKNAPMLTVDQDVVDRSISLPAANLSVPTMAPLPSNPVISSAVDPLPKPNSSEVEIRSPMIGTFYRAAGPDAPSFVSLGDKVKAGQTVCIIEAMKLFNEIEAEVSGKITKILVDDASPVEYDQRLFIIEPS